MRKLIVAGNWKMNKTAEEAKSLVENIKLDLADCQKVDVVVCPPFTALQNVCDVLSETQIAIGAQNMHWEQQGAFTGEIAPGMLKELYARYVILGHSERRAYFKEDNAIVNRKVKAALANNLRPIVCVGEHLEDRENGKTEAVVEDHVRGSLADIAPEDLKKLVVAYEPVWAIGTGKTATAEQAQEVHKFIRNVLADMADEDTAQSVRIQYGGSMKPHNADELLSQPDIDGGLIGGAALEAHPFVGIVEAALKQ